MFFLIKAVCKIFILNDCKNHQITTNLQISTHKAHKTRRNAVADIVKPCIFSLSLVLHCRVTTARHYRG